MGKTSEAKLVNGIKTALSDEGFVIQEGDNCYSFGSVNTPYGKLLIDVRGGSIFTKFEEHEKIPENVRVRMSVGMTGKWNFFGSDALRCFHSLFRQIITTAAAWAGCDDKPMINYNFYNGQGEPLRISCYMYKGDPKPCRDYITVVYTHASKAGYPKGTVLYRSMNGNPYHPACGIAEMGEGKQCSFKPGGSKVAFSDLPQDCKDIVLSDYKNLWEL